MPKVEIIFDAEDVFPDTASVKVERKVQAAKTEEERKMAVQEANFYRLNLVFSGEEADIVKNTLGKNPAEKLLALCQNG